MPRKLFLQAPLPRRLLLSWIDFEIVGGGDGHAMSRAKSPHRPRTDRDNMEGVQGGGVKDSVCRSVPL
jgi:hypothetical protein